MTEVQTNTQKGKINTTHVHFNPNIKKLRKTLEYSTNSTNNSDKFGNIKHSWIEDTLWAEKSILHIEQYRSIENEM